MVPIKTVELGEAGLAGLRLVTDKLNRRAERHGMEKLVVTVIDEWSDHNEDTGFASPRYLVGIEGISPCIDGWVLAARIENNELIGTVVRVVPGNYADYDYTRYRTHDFGCEHCNTKRRRNDVFVLADRDGNMKVVGRNCLADFIRTGDAGSFAEWAEWMDKLGALNESDFANTAYDDGFGEGVGRPITGLDRYLTATAMITRRIGWMSRTGARDSYGAVATADNVNYFIYGRGTGYDTWVRENELSLNPADSESATKAIEWAKSLTPEKTAKSEYLYTIGKIATVGMVGDGLDGFAASIIRAYDKDCEWATEKAEKSAGRKERVFIGDADKKGQQDLGIVRIVRTHYFEGNYGITTIVGMEVDLPDGTVAPIVWFASGEKDFEVGTEYTLRAGIKDHKDDPKYGKQTVVTRAKLTELKAVTT